MNYLAHLVLTDRTQDGFVGGLLGDFVKGRLDSEYPFDVERGIWLHRKIDVFTDAHDSTKMSRRRFSPSRRRFSGIVVDICYDHFLARHWRRYEEVEFAQFIQSVYASLTTYSGVLPARLSSILPRLVAEDWLSAYATLDGVDRALDGVANRLTAGERMRGAIEEVQDNYTHLEQDFMSFFPDVVRFSKRLRQTPNQE